MWMRSLISILLISLMAACGASDRRQFTLQGQILSVAPDGREANIKHEEIPGFMMAMTMPYKVRDAKEFQDLKPGDLITATLIVVSNDAYLENVKRVGEAPLEQVPESTAAPSAASGFELLKAGDPVPNSRFVNQDGASVDITSFKGSPLAITFIYTRCPMPTFCPLMDRHFVSVQDAIRKDPALSSVRLLSVSFDPIIDTPPVLKKHAAGLMADPKIWSFLTGDRDDIDKFASRFGVTITREMDNQKEIAHNLRTAVVDGQGSFVKAFTGNEWSPEELISDLRRVAGSK
jgi:protein SCO1